MAVGIIHQVDKKDKKGRLLDLLNDEERDPSERMLIFLNQKKQADFLMCFITLVGKKPATSIHGDRRQPESLADFNQGDCPILVATYGMINFLNKHVEVEVKHLLNYD